MTAQSVGAPVQDEGSSSATIDQAHSQFGPPPYQSLSYHRYRTSTSTSSSTSSPTTAASLLGPPSSFETPGTSPDTPSTSTSYCGPFQNSSKSAVDSRPESRFGSVSSAPRKFKNPKNLALNNLATPSSTALGDPPPSAAIAADSASPGIFSPSFQKPAPPRRKTTALGLTLQTPSSDTFAPAARIGQVPPTTSVQKPAALRLFQSTPSLPLQTSTFVPDFNNGRPQFASSFTDYPIDEIDDLREPEGKIKDSDAYPDGPVCIYEPYVYLYFEPTADEAAGFDVVINVASEVKNPFLETQSSANYQVTEMKDAVSALSERTFCATPTDPKRPSSSDQRLAEKRTEYFYIPWEHTTALVPGSDKFPGLHDIIRVIDDRVNAGKRVLIHCQCGVSRSASLIVAYGLFKNQNSPVQEIYDMVKQRSKWIGPNMGLIMQLQEYHNDLSKANAAARGHSKSGSKILHGRTDMNDPYASASSVPQTAPLPQDSSPSKAVPSPIQIENMPEVSAGPSSAPSDFKWPTIPKADSTDDAKLAIVPAFTEKSFVDASGHVLPEQTFNSGIANGRSEPSVTRADSGDAPHRPAPLRSIMLPPLSFASPQPLESPRSAQFAMTPVQPVVDDPSFGITSPRDASFAPSPVGSSPVNHSPFGRLSHDQGVFAPMSQPDDDIMLGLSSPRAMGFSSQMPSYFQAPPRIVPVQPSIESHASNANARADLRSRLGFSSNNARSAADLSSKHKADQARQPDLSAKRAVSPPVVLPPAEDEPNVSAALMSPRATEFTNNPFHDALRPERAASPSIVLAPAEDEPDLSAALMSPRATEFTNNPFHDALTPTTTPRQQMSTFEPILSTQTIPGDSVGKNATAKQQDPRSPPLKGASPINRNILEVLDS